MGRQRCKGSASFSILAQRKEGEGLSELGNDCVCHCRAGFLRTVKEPKLCPPLLSLHSSPQRSGGQWQDKG